MAGVLLKILGHFLSFECRHNSINQFQKSTYCPDCGEKVRINWITIKCQKCRSLRMPQTNGYGDVWPQKKHCASCGSPEWYSIRKESLALNETFFAVPVKDIVKEEKNKPSTSVWVDKPVGLSRMKPPKNIIKAKKGLRVDV